MIIALSPGTYLWFLIGQLYLDFWVDHPTWFGDFGPAILDNIYHHYVQTKDLGHWSFKIIMMVTMTAQIIWLSDRCRRVGRAADWASLACNAVVSVVFLTATIPNRDGMSEIGVGYQTDDAKRAKFVSLVKGLTASHLVELVFCLGGIVADHYASSLLPNAEPSSLDNNGGGGFDGDDERKNR